jgi:tetratricopeptide (TPR) repeat protein
MDPIEKQLDHASALRASSKFAEAAKVYEGLLLKKGLGEMRRAEAHQNAGDCLRLQGDFTGAKRHARAAARLFQKLASPRLVDARVSLALALRASGDPQSAVGLLRMALAFYEDDGDEDGIVFAHLGLGRHAPHRGRPPGGMEAPLESRETLCLHGGPGRLGLHACALGVWPACWVDTTSPSAITERRTIYTASATTPSGRPTPIAAWGTWSA